METKLLIVKVSTVAFLLALTFFLSAVNPLIARQKVHSGEDVINMMHKKYDGKWYKNLTFEQKTTFYGPDEEVQRIQTWFEAMKIPGRLAIKFDEKQSANGILFNNDVQYGFAEGEKIMEAERVHDLLVLGFDVYQQSPEKTIKQLRKAGYNLDHWYEDEWQDRAVFVIGTDKANPEKPQFWIDKEHLHFVRNLTIGRQNTLQEVQFNKYERIGEGWIAPEVILFVNGRKAMLEEYRQINLPDSLSDDIFNPEHFVNQSW